MGGVVHVCCQLTKTNTKLKLYRLWDRIDTGMNTGTKNGIKVGRTRKTGTGQRQKPYTSKDTWWGYNSVPDYV